MEEVDIAVLFVEDLGLALAPEICPDQSQTFKEVTYWLTFTVGREKISFFLCTGPLEVLQGKFVQSFAQKIEELTA